MGVSIPFNKSATAHNSVFAVRFAHPNAFGTSQTHKTLYTIGFRMLEAKIFIKRVSNSYSNGGG